MPEPEFDVIANLFTAPLATSTDSGVDFADTMYGAKDYDKACANCPAFAWCQIASSSSE
jgi:hypothetical protein